MRNFNLKDNERMIIIDCLKHCNGNKVHASVLLGLSYRGLRNKLAVYRLDGGLSKDDKAVIQKGRNKLYKNGE